MAVKAVIVRRLLYLRDHLSNLPEVGASWCAGLGQEILDQTYPNVVAHLLQLFVDFRVVVFVVFTQLRDDRAVCEGDELGADLVYSGSATVRTSGVWNYRARLTSRLW